MSEQTLHLLQTIQHRLRATIRRITLAELAYGLVLTVGICCGVWLLAVAIEAGFWLEQTPRTVLFWVLVLSSAGLIGYFLVLPALRLVGALRGPSEEAVARRIGVRYPEVSDRLVNLLQLSSGRRSEAPDPFVDGAVRMLGEQVQAVPFEQVEDFRRARRASRLAAVPVLGVLVFLLAAPGTFLGASMRLLTPGVHYQHPAPFRLVVEPGSVELARGASLDVVVRAEGRELPRTIMLALNNLDEALVEEVQLTRDSTGVYRHTVVNVRQSFRYRASAEPVQTEWYEAAVTERPLVRGLQVSLAFPAYTRIPPQRLEPNVGDVTALKGTRVSIDVGLGGQQVEEAFLRFDDGRIDTLEIDGVSASGTFVHRAEGTYQVVLRNASGLENSDPITYTLRVVEDAYPSVTIVEPEPESDLTDALRTALRVRMTDDFGFSGLQLFYRLAESRFGEPQETFVSRPLPLDAPSQLDQDLWFDWLVSEGTGLDPVPGDVIEYYVEVRDNDAVAGFKAARSAVHRLRVPSLAEQYEEVDRQQNAAEEQLEELLQQTQTVAEQFRQLRDELRSKREADWEDKRQLEQLQQRQQQLEEQVETLTEQMESITEQMRENNLISEETAQMYQELRKVLEEVNSPELQEALRKLQESLENLNLQQMQEAIENFEFNEDQYRQRLERSLELFKKIRTQQKLDEAAKLAEDLARQEERLREETRKLQEQLERNRERGDRDDRRDGENEASESERTGEQDEQQEGNREEGEREGERRQGEQSEGERQDGERQEGERQEGENQSREQAPQKRAEELSAEQQRARQEMERLLEKLSELREQMQEMRQAPTQQMQQLDEQLRQQQLPQQMQQNSEQLRQMQLNQAQQGQQQMQQQLEQLQQQLRQMQTSMQGQQMNVNMAGLRRALSDVLSLSQQQEDLRSSIRNHASEQTPLRDQARRQVELSEGLSTVTDTLQQLSREIPQMSREVQRHAGEALRAMGSATEAMGERAVAEVSGQQKVAMTHLNELALLLSDLMNQMMNQQQGGQGGMSMQQMLEQLQQMSQQQQQLNEQIQQFLNDMQGNRLSVDMQERLEQMRAQQESIQRQLRQLNRNPEARGKMLGDLNKIAEQMEETIQELQRRQVDPRTVDRQRQILQRLLDAQRSIRERGEEKKRQGREGRDVVRESPGPLSPAEEAEKLRRDLIRALESGYAPDYEELIKRYFELLQRQSQEAP